MRAIQYKSYGSPNVLELTEIEKPVPKENEVLVKIHAATVSAVDSIFRKGKQFFARMATGVTKPKKTILGNEFAGVIEAIGKNVKSFKVGDEVYGAYEGTHQEYISISENDAITTKPSNLNFNEAAAIPYGSLTALPFLRDTGKIKSGQKILVIGASGSVGIFAVQFAKYYGAEVTGFCSSSNVKLVQSLGADNVIDYTKEDFNQIGIKYDIIFDAVGKSSFSACKNSLTKNGLFLTTVISFKIIRQMLTTSIIGTKKAIITFTGMRKPGDKKKDLIFIKELIESGKIKPVIDNTYPLENSSEAHIYVDKGHKKGDVLLTMV